METNLLNCPFCGGTASFGTVRISYPSPIENRDGTPRTLSYYAHCMNCQANNNGIVHGYQTEADAAVAWNGRIMPE